VIELLAKRAQRVIDGGAGRSLLGAQAVRMIDGKRIAVVMPGYNAERTLEQTAREIPGCVDVTILVGDGSSDRTSPWRNVLV
jgi:hypothetical protein